MELVAPINSTTVRTINKRAEAALPLSTRALRRLFPVLGREAPATAAALAELVFRSPPAYRAEPSELDAFFLADHHTLQLGTGTVPIYSFGHGPAVVLVHGWGGRATQLRSFVEPIVGAGFRAVLFDAPGHGDASGSLSSLPQFAAALSAVLRWAGQVRGVVAHSMGAPATVLALRDHPLPIKLVFIAPPSALSHATSRFGRMLAIPEQVIGLLERRIEARFLRPVDDYDLLRHAPNMTQPLLVIHDRQDREVPLRSGEGVTQRWPNAELFVTEGLGHVKLLRAPLVIERALAHLSA